MQWKAEQQGKRRSGKRQVMQQWNHRGREGQERSSDRKKQGEKNGGKKKRFYHGIDGKTADGISKNGTSIRKNHSNS